MQSVCPGFEDPPTDPPPLEFQLADPERLRKELSAAGLTDVSVETLVETTEHRSGNDLWDWIVSSNPIAESILSGMLGLSEEERGAVREGWRAWFANAPTAPPRRAGATP